MARKQRTPLGEFLPTWQIQDRLKKHYDPRAYGLLFEVGNSTGGNCVRHADALAMSLWPSRGLELIGHEIKASRSDWLSELKKPWKADAICCFCDRWYIVAGHASIVESVELPEEWGLMLPTEDGLHVAKEAIKRTPTPVNRGFLAAMFRKVHEQGVDSQVVAAAITAAQKEAEERVANRPDSWKQEATALREAISIFEQASGVRISEWNAGDIGRAVRSVLNGEHRRDEAKLKTIRDIAAKIVEKIDTEMQA